MPSPFPGMDPYLEDPLYWRSIHQVFIAQMWFVISGSLPPEYAAQTEQRLYVVQTGRANRGIAPDVSVTRHPPPPGAVTGNTTEVADPAVLYVLPPEEVTEDFIQIVTLEPDSRVVTTIELLSPANKSQGRGREEYLRNRWELLRSDVHLLEIDLLRGGEQTVTVPEVQRPGAEYCVSLHRGDHSWRFETWSFGVRDRLPRVLVPLSEGTPDLILDLQAVLDRIYDVGRYRSRLNYGQNPSPPMTPEDLTWLDALLRDAGLRA